MSQIAPEVAARMKAVMAEFGIDGYRAFGALWGATGSAVNNWLNGYNHPRVPEMIQLCAWTGVTLDWLYRGHAGSIDPELAARLNGPAPAVSLHRIVG